LRHDTAHGDIVLMYWSHGQYMQKNCRKERMLTERP